MDSDPKNYLAYLLRLWQVNQDGDCVWRASLENSHTGERRGFASLDLMMIFLTELLQQSTGDEQNNRITDTTGEPI
jgi:hypothetical protein